MTLSPRDWINARTVCISPSSATVVRTTVSGRSDCAWRRARRFARPTRIIPVSRLTQTLPAHWRGRPRRQRTGVRGHRRNRRSSPCPDHGIAWCWSATAPITSSPSCAGWPASSAGPCPRGTGTANRRGCQRVAARTGHGPVAAQVTRFFARRGADASRAADEALDGDRYLALLDAIDALLADPPLTPAADTPARVLLPTAVAKAVKRHRDRHRTRPWRPSLASFHPTPPTTDTPAMATVIARRANADGRAFHRSRRLDPRPVLGRGAMLTPSVNVVQSPFPWSNRGKI